jgi:hypothetical protein
MNTFLEIPNEINGCCPTLNGIALITPREGQRQKEKKKENCMTTLE